MTSIAVPKMVPREAGWEGRHAPGGLVENSICVPQCPPAWCVSVNSNFERPKIGPFEATEIAKKLAHTQAAPPANILPQKPHEPERTKGGFSGGG